MDRPQLLARRCTACGVTDAPRIRRSGSVVITGLLVWATISALIVYPALAVIFAALFLMHFLWRRNSKHLVCPNCDLRLSELQ